MKFFRVKFFRVKFFRVIFFRVFFFLLFFSTRLYLNYSSCDEFSSFDTPLMLL